MDNSVITQPTNPNKVTTLNYKDPHQIESQDARFLQESQHFLSIFPKEVWDHICSFLERQDFQNLNNSSQFFQQLFLRKRIFLLFEPVLEIMLPKLGSYAGYSYSAQDKVRNARSVILRSRLACKTWKRTIDKMACIWNEPKLNKSTSVHHLLSVNYNFYEYQQIDKFLQYFKTTHHSDNNPFPGKYISLQFKAGQQTWSKTILNLLEKYGKHLRTCQMSLYFGNANPPEAHQKMMAWLNCMPNLQNLSFSYIFHTPSNSASLTQLEDITPKFTFLRKLVVSPFRISLRDLHNPNRSPSPNWSWLERYHLSNVMCQPENLELLNVVIFNRSGAEILGNVSSPLKRLAVKYNCKEDDMKLTEVFTRLSEKFSGSLEDLEITFEVNGGSSGHLQIMRDSFCGRLNLPILRKLEIKILSVHCLDFLLGMEGNLEEVKVICVSERPRYYEYSRFSEEQRKEIGEMEGKQIIKFLGYHDKMLESNIWRVFPKLRKITLNTFSGEEKEFSRRDWVKAQQLI